MQMHVSLLHPFPDHFVAIHRHINFIETCLLFQTRLIPHIESFNGIHQLVRCPVASGMKSVSQLVGVRMMQGPFCSISTVKFMGL
jgi:hypothetical protein